MSESQSATIQKTIDQLEADAEAHGRIARQNREQAQQKYALRDELVAWCKANGINVVRGQRAVRRG